VATEATRAVPTASPGNRGSFPSSFAGLAAPRDRRKPANERWMPVNLRAIEPEAPHRGDSEDGGGEPNIT